ncbi:hypothetical protein SBBP1_90019 [Burkholderiales bacterium]|nr:hypothetical protein SBBP1_90019 [Burkholderiales bacterium]
MSAAPAALRRLGPLRVADFLARYWQREAICLRQAIAGFACPVSRAQLIEMVRDPDVESRLVSAFSGRWRVQHGPFAASALPSLRRSRWTLLVQGVDLHDPSVAALAARFRFLPAARFDDVMVSYATDGGGVGPHVDQYDVFLLQAQGRRRWRIATEFDPQLVEGMPLRVLANFGPQREWILEPGDLLYLPAGVAHEGVALGASITISIGFRLPAWQEILDAWSERQSRVAPRSTRLVDSTRRPTSSPARLPAAMVESATRELRRSAPSRIDVRRTLLEHLSPLHATAVQRRPAALRRNGAPTRHCPGPSHPHALCGRRPCHQRRAAALPGSGRQHAAPPGQRAKPFGGNATRNGRQARARTAVALA